jgi:hypothetical protein
VPERCPTRLHSGETSPFAYTEGREALPSLPRGETNSYLAVGSAPQHLFKSTHTKFLLFSPILKLAIDFSIHTDFVEPLPNYFAVMFPALLLIFAATLYRVGYAFVGAPVEWANFSPLAAILLCGAAYLPRKIALLLGAGPIVVADLILNAHYHAPLIDTGMFARYFAFGLILFLGFRNRQQRYNKLLFLFASTLAASFLFYLITNTGAWMMTAAYSKTLPGWWQALTIGLPGFPSTLFFFRNTVFSDLFFTVLFVVAQTIFTTSRARITEAAPSTVRIPIQRRQS